MSRTNAPRTSQNQGGDKRVEVDAVLNKPALYCQYNTESFSHFLTHSKTLRSRSPFQQWKWNQEFLVRGTYDLINHCLDLVANINLTKVLALALALALAMYSTTTSPTPHSMCQRHGGRRRSMTAGCGKSSIQSLHCLSPKQLRTKT